MPLVVTGQLPPAQVEEGTLPGEPTWETTEWPVCAVLADSGAAWRVQLEWPVGFTLWLPQSQCRFSEERTWVTIPGWLAKEKGLPATNTEYPD